MRQRPAGAANGHRHFRFYERRKNLPENSPSAAVQEIAHQITHTWRAHPGEGQPMTEQERIAELMKRLRQLYPDAKCSLDFTDALELLVATILAGQCTDERVNQVTKTLFKKYRTAADYSAVPLQELEADLSKITFYRNKAKHIQEACTIIVNRYKGEVPKTMRELLGLPGVARKTANVVLGNAFGMVEGVIVDTHAGRISQRLGLTTSSDPVMIEQVLMRKLPREDWLDYTHLLIYHGRAICKAPKALCGQCTLVDLCPTGTAALAAAEQPSSHEPHPTPPGEPPALQASRPARKPAKQQSKHV
jgi:endonuclease-3